MFTAFYDVLDKMALHSWMKVCIAITAIVSKSE